MCHGPRRVFDGQLLRDFKLFIPGLGRALRVQSGSSEGILVIVKNWCRPLEWNSVGDTVNLAVLHKRRKETANPVFDVIFGKDFIPLPHTVLIDKEKYIDCQQHGHGRGVTSFACCEEFCGGVSIRAGKNGFDGDVGVLS